MDLVEELPQASRFRARIVPPQWEEFVRIHGTTGTVPEQGRDGGAPPCIDRYALSKQPSAVGCASHAHRRIPIGTPDSLALIQLACVTLVAAAVQGALGFGFTLLAVSFFLLIIQSGDAVQLLIVINLAISLALIGRLWRNVNRALWTRLVIGAFLGFPLGLMAFQNADVDQLKVMVAATLLTFVAWTVLQRWSTQHGSDATPRFRTPSAIGVGALAGGMTTALGMPGPALVLYLTAVGVGKEATRSISLTFFVVSYGVALILQAATVGVSTGVWVTAALLVPVAGVGALLGHVLARRVSETLFRRAVLTLVAATGAYVLFDALIP